MVRRIPDLGLVDKPWVEQAEDFVLYYDICVEESGPAWLLGLFVAHQWLRLIKDPQPNLEEGKLMLKVLESERARQGSGWSDMYCRVKRWIEETESA